MNNKLFKALLINPPSGYPGEIPQRCWPPLNLALIAGPLVESGIGVGILDANALGISVEEVCRQAVGLDSDLIGIPLYSEKLNLIYNLTAALKKYLPDCRIVLGGTHAGVLPGPTLQQFRCVDYILRGEADKSLLQLCLAIREEKSLATVDGLSFRNNAGEVVHNRPVELDDNIDVLPHPKRELLEPYYKKAKYNTIILPGTKIDTLITSRGCSFQCNFCHNIDSRYRAHSVGYLMEEVFSMYARGVRVIEVVDDNFTVDRSRAIAFFKRLIKENLKIALRIKSRVDTVDKELMRFARDAGVYLIAYGAESGSQYILGRMNKNIKVKDIIESCLLTKKMGIYCHTSWILGYPGETPQTVNETIKLIKAIKPTTVQIEILKPYPLTAVYNEALLSHTLKGKWDPLTEEQPWVGLPWIKQYSDLWRIRKAMLRSVYLTPYYVAHFFGISLKTFNHRLLRYAFQEFFKVIAGGNKNVEARKIKR